MAIQPPSLRRRPFVVSTPEIATPVPPVQPSMTKAQEAEMEGWFLKDIWRGIMDRLKGWRFCGGGTLGMRNAAASSLAALSKLVDNENENENENENGGFLTTGTTGDDGLKAKKRWGEERDSWLNKGYAPYFGAQWIGVLPGPGVDDPPDVSIGINDDGHTAGYEL